MITKAILTGILILSAASVFANGPNGFGPILIGMTKQEVDAIDQTGPINISGPLVLFQRPQPIPNRSEYTSLLRTPYSPEPIKLFLRFDDQKLTTISLSLNENQTSLFEDFRNQIEKKYGAVTPRNTMKEEQCILRNGNNFKVKNGTIAYVWKSKTESPQHEVVTVLSDFISNTCPVNGYQLPRISSTELDISLKKATGNPQPISAF